ncbi:MAG TPA: TIGR03619 family F420-dependent LLM class oxidoreductase [Conexibacter sp.]
MARTLEEAGYDSLWVSDHIVLPETIRSRYPFSEDGIATWPTDSPYFDALIALALAAAATERVRLGTAVLVLPLRNPVQFAKQAASIDVASNGRLELAVGAGWLEEEFDALGVPFKQRGTRMVEWLAIARDCWSGRTRGHSSVRYELAADTLCLPTPAHQIPVMIGGHSPLAIGRAGTVGDGWLAQHDAHSLDPDEIERAIATMQEAAREAGGDGSVKPRVVLRIVGSMGKAAEVAKGLPALARAGVDEVIVDVPVELDGAKRDLDVLRAGAAQSLGQGPRIASKGLDQGARPSSEAAGR